MGIKALPGEDPPSACDSLKDDQRKLTFSAFGSVDQKYGLFPFTEKSINNLIESYLQK